MIFNVLNDGEPQSASTRSVLSVVRKHGPLPRSEITGHLSLSQQSVHRIVDSLIEQNMLTLLEPTISGRGKPSPRVALDQTTHVSFGLSIGTEQARVCGLDLTGRPLFTHDLVSKPNHCDEVREEFRAVTADWVARSRTAVAVVGAGIAMQGYRRGQHDVFYPPRPLDSWQEISVNQFFSETTALPFYSENNATSSAIAEYYLGSVAPIASLAYLSFNFGFGSGLVVRGDPATGTHGNAGEISSIFEGDQIRARPALEGLLRVVTDDANPTPRHLKEVLTALDVSDEKVRHWVDWVAPQLRLAIRALKAIADPSAIVFGGEAPHELRLRLVEASRSAFGEQSSPNPTLVASRLEGDPAHLGAAFLPLHRHLF